MTVEQNVDLFVKVGGEGEGGKKAMTVLFIRENVNYDGRPLRCLLYSSNYKIP